jgi:Flp pilus assembly protein TadG
MLKRVLVLIRGGNEGQAMVEMALILPILMILSMGIWEFGSQFYRHIELQSAVDDATRMLQSSRALNTMTDPCAAAVTAIATAAPTLTASSLNVVVKINGTTEPANTCSGAQTNMVAFAPIQVTATYPYSVSIPLLGFTLQSGVMTSSQTAFQY